VKLEETKTEFSSQQNAKLENWTFTDMLELEFQIDVSISAISLPLHP
jgi:hypothetical protein